MSEYALIFALVAVLAVASLMFFGSQIRSLLSTSTINSALTTP